PHARLIKVLCLGVALSESLSESSERATTDPTAGSLGEVVQISAAWQEARAARPRSRSDRRQLETLTVWKCSSTLRSWFHWRRGLILRPRRAARTQCDGCDMRPTTFVLEIPRYRRHL